MLHHEEERAVNVQLGRYATGIALLMSKVGIVGIGYRCTAKVRLMELGARSEAFSNCSDNALVISYSHHNSTLLRRQMGIDSWHSSTLQERVLHLVLETVLSISHEIT